MVYQSVSPRFYRRKNYEHLISKYNLPDKFILSVGTIEQRKNQLSILKALYSSGIENTVVFVGKLTLYSAELLKFITENKMESQVKFLNNISRKDLAGLYQLAGLSIYISMFEGFGLPVIESMASGCPVITSNVSCLPETAGNAAVLCDPGNITVIGKKIKLLLGNDEYRNEMIEKGNERAKLFHPEKYSQNLISLYSGIIDN